MRQKSMRNSRNNIKAGGDQVSIACKTAEHRIANEARLKSLNWLGCKDSDEVRTMGGSPDSDVLRMRRHGEPLWHHVSKHE